MKLIFLAIIFTVFTIHCLAQQNTPAIAEKCDFSEYKPLKVDHFLQMALIQQVQPQYPTDGKSVRAAGNVRIKILVDRSGKVQKACAVEGHPLLQSSALSAAYKSRFKSNFGFSKASAFRGEQYITDELVYNFVVPSQDQECYPLLPDPKPILLGECRLIADGRGHFSNSKYGMGADLKLYLLGKQTDIVPTNNATYQVNNDVLTMRLSYRAPESIIPTSAYLELRSFSTKPRKYETNHKLTITVDDKLILSDDLEMRSSIVIAEIFTYSMKFTDFLKFTEAKQITFQFGETTIKLKAEDIKALNELNKTTNGLKQHKTFSGL
jgi:hypothetical protein